MCLIQLISQSSQSLYMNKKYISKLELSGVIRIMRKNYIVTTGTLCPSVLSKCQDNVVASLCAVIGLNIYLNSCCEFDYLNSCCEFDS